MSRGRSTPRRPALLAVCLLTALLPAATAAAVERDEATLREAARLRGVALARMEEGDYAGAVDDLEALAEILPDNVLPPINLAIAHFRLDHHEAALAAIRRARELDPDNPRTLFTLARILELEPSERALWREVVERFAALHPGDPRPHYLRAEVGGRDGRRRERLEALAEALRRTPENLVPMAELLATASAAGDLEAAADALDAVEDRLDGFDGPLAELAERLRESLAEGDAEAARPPATMIRNLLRPTELYRVGLAELVGRDADSGPMFPQLDFSPPLPRSVQGGQDIEIAFVDRSAETRLAALPAAGLGLVTHGDDRDRLLAVGDEGALRIELAGGAFRARPLAAAVVGEAWLRRDLDQDGVVDLAAAGRAAGVVFWKGGPESGWGEPVRLVEPSGEAAVTRLAAVDLDHDGDLDLLVARAGAADLYLRNNLDGSWSEIASQAGLDGGAADTRDLAVADFDDDGDLDLAVATGDGGLALYLNRRRGPFEDATRRLGLEGIAGAVDRVLAHDLDNDGLWDLLLATPEGPRWLVNRGARFEEAPLPEGLPRRWSAAAVADFDNDGDLDAVVAGPGGRPLLARNRRGRFEAEALGPHAAGLRALDPGDFDGDGDLDLLAELDDGTRRYWSNEGGNRNQWLRLRLRGRSDNNSKNNLEGVSARIEVKAGDGFQAVLGNGGVNHLGLGANRQADVLRVVWTNGLAQVWLQVAANQTLVEEQVLKGSCPFLYTWNGDGFEFVTDLMWTSPLGMFTPDGTPAPHASARDWVLVRGEALRPAGGDLWLQITEELWEAAYVDRVRLLALDHPAGVEPVVDERFLPPPHSVEPPLHWLTRRLRPVAARDQRGRDVLARVAERDGLYVDDLPLSRYQGLTLGHALELDFPPPPPGARARLVLEGWIFPTDSTINVALSQDASRTPRGPSLEIRRPDGSWRMVSPFIGFPNGKRKAMVIELPADRPSGPLAVRLAGNAQIYWDRASLAVGDDAPRRRITALEPRWADLHYRGYSRLYRQGSGPHLYDYRTVAAGARFRDLEGRYTRFGRVEELLRAADDRYVVMNAGDELTLRFDAAGLPELPPGWVRDWALYTDGWVKDGDLHTSHSATVAPLPYHGMSAYPDTPFHRYPDTPRHADYLRRYQTREVSDRCFRRVLAGDPTPGDVAGCR